ncbi:tRNA (adenosine(37)-N6)-threonylcarbamoyltransferase complex transferase subunit TsaD [bacterium]|nr:tRNA (adenosine(37)-N6)-threonylcarbamoyltransferase complex transferase subunit TsaD [bacterium]
MLEYQRGSSFRPFLVLALETSCDETSVAILKDGQQVVCNRIASQEELHARYGGVVPEIACRRHFEVIHPLIEEVLEDSSLSLSEMDALAVTHGPGLIGAVLVGVTVAKTLALAFDKPLLPVNHLEGHLYSPLLEHPQLKPPWVSLLVSGGHTLLVLVEDWGQLRLLGQTRDDAAGEAFDKVAKMLNLGYPGGPRVQQLAEQGDPAAIRLPRPMRNQGYAFSFSGLKTAVHHAQSSVSPADLCASFQQAVVDVLVEKTLQAAMDHGVNSVSLAGGVAANQPLRQALLQQCQKRGINFYVPSFEYCTDNGAMIAMAGYQMAGLGITATPWLDAHASLPLQSWRNSC